MPAATRYVVPDDTFRANTTSVAVGEIAERARIYTHIKEYYDGKQKKHLDRKEGEPDDNVIINMVKIILDRTAGMLGFQIPAFQLEDELVELSPDEIWLSNVWQTNGGTLLLNKMIFAGAMSGHVFLRVIPPAKKNGIPKIRVLPPKNTMAYWHEEDKETPLWFTQMWTSADGKTDHLIDYVKVFDPSGDPTKDEWRIFYYTKEGSVWGSYKMMIPWKSPYGPVTSWQHLPNLDEFYGTAEADATVLNDSINLAVSEGMRINRYHAAPKTVAVGVEDSNEITETAIDGLWTVENAEARFNQLEMQSDGEFTMALISLLRDAILTENRVVLLSGSVKDFQRVTDASVRTVFMDALVKNQLLRESYGRGMQRVSVASAFSAGKTIKEPDLLWFDPLPADETAAMDIIERELGLQIVSRQRAAAKRNLNWRANARQMLEEARILSEIDQARTAFMQVEDEEGSNQETGDTTEKSQGDDQSSATK